MKILLVLPAAGHLRVTRESPDVPRRAMLRFSVLPLTIVAALTPPEHEVVVCDENVGSGSFTDRMAVRPSRESSPVVAIFSFFASLSM